MTPLLCGVLDVMAMASGFHLWSVMLGLCVELAVATTEQLSDRTQDGVGFQITFP